MHVLNAKKALGRALTGQYVPPVVSSKGFEEKQILHLPWRITLQALMICATGHSHPNDHLAKSAQMTTEQQALYKSNQAALDHAE